MQTSLFDSEPEKPKELHTEVIQFESYAMAQLFAANAYDEGKYSGVYITGYPDGGKTAVILETEI